MRLIFVAKPLLLPGAKWAGLRNAPFTPRWAWAAGMGRGGGKSRVKPSSPSPGCREITRRFRKIGRCLQRFFFMFLNNHQTSGQTVKRAEKRRLRFRSCVPPVRSCTGYLPTTGELVLFYSK